MPYSTVTYTANGTDTDFLITWNYLDTDHIRVKVGGMDTTDSTSTHQFSMVDSKTIRVTDLSSKPVIEGLTVELLRNTPIRSRAVTFAEGSALRTTDLNKNSDFLLYSMQEALDTIDVAAQEGAAKAQAGAEAAQIAAENARDLSVEAKTLAEGAEARVAADKAAASLAALNAASSESKVAQYQSDSAASAAAAKSSQEKSEASEANSAKSENNAAASAQAAAGSASSIVGDAEAASGSAASAQAALKSFEQLYLGSKSSEPDQANDGTALVAGMLYWNNAENNMRVFSGTEWSVLANDFVPASTGGSFGGNVSVSGNISVSGSVDGRNVAADGAKLDGIESGAKAVTNNNQIANGRGYITSSSFSNTRLTGNTRIDTVDLGNWTIRQSGSNLKFSYNGTDRFNLSSSGHLTVENNVTAYGGA